MNALDTRAAVAHVRAFYETLRPSDVGRLGEIYATHVHFRDPFNEVRGLAEIRRVSAQMFEQLDDCRFVFRDTVADERGAMFAWDRTFRIRRLKPQEVRSIHGASHLRFDASGRVVYHRDYWDAAGELYARLPLIGPVMRWLQRRIG